MNATESDQAATPSKRVFMSRAFVLGGLAGSLETLLVLATGVAPPAEIAFNFGLLVTVFAAVAGGWLIVRRLPILRRIPGESVLVAVSILVFALRGCLHNCEEWAPRLAIPTTVGVTALVLLSISRDRWPGKFGSSLVLIATGAMTLAAFDFALRDGLRGSSATLFPLGGTMAILGTLSTSAVSRGWPTKLLWTLFLGIGSIYWAYREVRPLRIEPDAKQSASRGSPKRPDTPNVIVVVLDTVRADHLSLYGYARRTAPNLEALAAESLVFEHAIASGNYSLPSHGSLFTGLLPSQHGAHQRFGEGGLAETFRRIDSGLSAEVITMASRLKDLGLVTGGLSANYAYLAKWTGLQQGFDTFDDRPKRLLGYHPFSFPFQRRLLQPNQRPDERAEWEAPIVTEAATSFVEVVREPFFLFLNYLDPHDPHFPRSEHLFRGDGLGSDVRPIPAYDSEIAYTDADLGRLLARLRRDSLLDRTVLVVTSDHGEFFGEHGFTNHKVGAYEEILHIPLLVRYPKAIPPGTVKRPFGLHEVHRLLLDLVESRDTSWVTEPSNDPRVLAQVWGKVSSNDTIAGAQSLEPDANVVYQGSYKLIARRRGPDELFDLAVDPSETQNLLVEAGPDVLARRQFMRSAIRKLPPARQGTDPDASAEDLAALRGLGYISLKRPDRR